MAVAETVDQLRDAPPIVRLNRRIKLLYGIGDIANALKIVISGLFTLFFYSTVMGLPAALVGVASAIGVVWDAVIDPYIGHFSDTTRSYFGRRQVLMLAGSAAMGLSFWAFFSPPVGLSTAGLFLWLLISGLLVRSSTSLFGVPYYALGATLSRNYDERTEIVAIRGALALFGTLLAAALSFVIFFPDTGTDLDPKLNFAGYSAMGLTFGIAMTGVTLATTIATRPWHTSQSSPAQPAEQLTFGAGLRRSLGNPSFRILFLSFALCYLALVINSSLSIHYLTLYAGVSKSANLSTFQLAFYGMAIFGVAFWWFVSRFIEKRRLYLLGLTALAAIMLSAYFLVGDGHVFGAGNVVALAIGHGLGGFFGSIVWFVPGAMTADVTDDDELASGQRREGTFFGLLSFGQQMAAGAAILITGVLVDWFARLQPGLAVQPARTSQRIGMIFGLLPALLLLVAAALSLRYALTRARVATIQVTLGQRKNAQSL